MRHRDRTNGRQAHGLGTEQPTPIRGLSVGGHVILIKDERFAPTGSHKGRAGAFLTQQFVQRGVISDRHRTQLVVLSSGNFAMAVAANTETLNVDVTVVTDVLSPRAFVDKLDRFPHVSLIVVNDPDETGSHMKARKKRVAELKGSNGELIDVNQYDNRLIPVAYERTLAQEIYDQTRGEIGAVFVPVGTGGLVNGINRLRKKLRLDFKIFAIDADGSCLARPPRHGARRRLSGYGNGLVTGLVREVFNNLDYWVFVEDHEAVSMCHRLVTNEDLFVGPSSGAVLAGLEKVITRQPDLLPKRGHIVVVFPDGGDNYQDTVFNNDWLSPNGFPPLAAAAVPHEEGRVR